MSDAPGWDAIDAALAPIYSDSEPKHYGTIMRWRLGGPDPLDGISAYRRAAPVPHWHFITYGMSELYEKESDNAHVSGWGFEFTFRLAREPAETEPPGWALHFLQNLARYVFNSGNNFEAGHHMDLNGPMALEREDTAVRAAAIALDPELGRIDTPHGALEFLQIVGLTTDEYDAAQGWRTGSLLDLMADKLPLLVTDLDRRSLMADPEVGAAVRAGVERDGSATASVAVQVLNAQLRAGTTTLTFGAHPIDRILRLLRGRLPFGRPLNVHGPDQAVTFTPGTVFSARQEGPNTDVTLPPGTVDELIQTIRPVAGEYRVPSAPGLVIHIERSVITDGEGNIVETVG
jgi:suppressor of fused